jgi:hypothetical protein
MCTSWFDCMTCSSPWIQFWLCNKCDTSMPYPSYPTLSSTYRHH